MSKKRLSPKERYVRRRATDIADSLFKENHTMHGHCWWRVYRAIKAAMQYEKRRSA